MFICKNCYVYNFLIICITDQSWSNFDFDDGHREYSGYVSEESSKEISRKVINKGDTKDVSVIYKEYSNQCTLLVFYQENNTLTCFNAKEFIVAKFIK